MRGRTGLFFLAGLGLAAGLVAAPLPSTPPADAWAKAFIKANPQDLGVASEEELVLSRAAQSPLTGATHLVFEWRPRGVRYVGGDLRVTVAPEAWPRETLVSLSARDADRRILSAMSTLDPRPAPAFVATLGPTEALVAAAMILNRDPPALEPTNLAEAVLAYPDPAGVYAHDAWVEAVYLPSAVGPTAAWRVELDGKGGDGRFVVYMSTTSMEALTMRRLDRGNAGLVFDGEYPSTGGCPGRGVGQSLKSFDATPSSPLAWVSDNLTTGNNAAAYENLSGASFGHGQPAPESSPGQRIWSYTFKDAYAHGLSAEGDVWAAATNVFYHANRFHDRLYQAGFDEAAGNFQAVNLSGVARGGDPVQVLVQDSSLGVNNATSYTPPDGYPEVVRLMLYRPPGYVRRDSAFDAQVLTHELGHGVADRLVGSECMLGIESAGLAEGLADYFALGAFADPVHGAYVSGDCVKGLRRSSYAASPFPYTYDAVCNPPPAGGCESHNDGEIWAASLWRALDRVEALYGDRNQATCVVDQLLVEALRGVPCAPTFLDLRDSVLAASRAAAPSTTCDLWQAFAALGMGAGALSDGGSNRVPSFVVPGACSNCTLSAVGLQVQAMPINAATLAWQPVPGAERYNVWRRNGGCGSACEGQPAARVAELTAPGFVDQSLSGGTRYGYWVTASGAGDCVSRSACVEVVTSGSCTDPPVYVAAVGVAAAAGRSDLTCAVDLAWNPAAAACITAGSPAYEVYRGTQPDFVPSAINLVINAPPSTLVGTDASTSLVSDTMYTYVVRARDALGNNDHNEVRAAAVPRGPVVGSRTYLDLATNPDERRPTTAAEPLGATGGWTASAGQGGSEAWTAPPPSGAAAKVPAAAWDLVLPPFTPTATTALSFMHTFETETLFDGGLIELSGDGGGTWSDLGPLIQEGGYNRGVAAFSAVTYLLPADSHARFWSGVNSAGKGVLEPVKVDLSSFAGQRDVLIRFRLVGDADQGLDLMGWRVTAIALSGVEATASCCPGGTQCLVPEVTVMVDGPACLGAPVHLVPRLDKPGCGVWSLLWQFGDGAKLPAGALLDAVDHVYAAAGAYNGTLGLTGFNGCWGLYSFTANVAENVVPTGSVDNLLRLSKLGADVVLTWDGGPPLDPPSYNVHATADRAALVATQAVLGATPIVASTTTPQAVLSGLAGSLYFSVVGRETCTGRSVLP